MPTIKFPKNPNTDTAFVEQDDGTKNRALMIAPQDISTLELPNNPNSTKGYITVDGKKQRVILTADITGGGGGGSGLPDQTGHSGEFLTTDGTDASWAAVDALPSQTGNAGKFLTTDGTDASWATLVAQTSNDSNRYIIMGEPSQYTGGIGSIKLGYKGFGSYGALGQYSISIGDGAYSSSNAAISLGQNARAGSNGLAIGSNASTGQYSIACGYYSSATATGCVMINLTGSIQTNSDANTVKIANANGNFEMMSANGTIPTARLTKVNTTITIAVADWNGGTTVTKTVNGITATGVVLVSPDPTDQSAYTSAGILCTAQAADSLTFTCSTTPSADIDVNVVML